MIWVPKKCLALPRKQRGFFTLPGGIGAAGMPGGGGGGGAPYPVVESLSSLNGLSSGTDPVITLPSGVTPEDLLLLVFSCDGNPTISIGSGTGWNIIGQASSGSNLTQAIIWKVATGSDALTLHLTAGEQGTYVCFRVSGASAVTATSANGSSTNANPPNHAPAGGSDKYLWFATMASNGQTVASAAPTNYGDLQTVTQGSGGTTNAASTSVARRELEAASENPGTFTSANAPWVAWTVAVT